MAYLLCHDSGMTSTDPLAKAARAYLRGQKTLEDLRQALVDQIGQIDPEQVSQADIIRRTGLSRETVRKMERAAGIERRPLR